MLDKSDMSRQTFHQESLSEMSETMKKFEFKYIISVLKGTKM